MATYVAPVTWAQTGTIVGEPTVWGAEMDVALADAGDATDVFLPSMYDATGSGNDTVTFAYRSGIGGGKVLTARASEMAAIQLSGYDRNTYTGTLAQYVDGFGESQFDMTLRRPDQSIQTGQIPGLLAEQVMTTNHYLHMVAGSGLSTVKGSSGAALSVATMALVVAHFTETGGFRGQLRGWVHPEQITDLRASLASYTGYQFPAETTQFQSFVSGVDGSPTMSLFGVPLHASTWVQQSGGDWQGFVAPVEKFGRIWARPAALAGAIELYRDDNLGVYIAASSDPRQSNHAIYVVVYTGVCTIAGAVVPGTCLRSVND